MLRAEGRVPEITWCGFQWNRVLMNLDQAAEKLHNQPDQEQIRCGELYFLL